MCSNFELAATIREVADYTNIGLDKNIAFNSWNTHIFPFHNAPVIINFQHEPTLSFMRYSLTPSWSKVAKPKFASYNARLDRVRKDNNELEFIYNSPAWKLAFNKHHCLVPLTGFFESCKEGSHAGNIVKFSQKDERLLLAAGIWDKWTNLETGEVIYSFAIITDEPVPFILEVGHDRQPVFLSQEDGNRWLKDTSLYSIAGYNFLKNSQQKINYIVSNYRPLKANNFRS